MITDFICGFCEHKNKADICSNCRIEVMCANSEELAAKARWEHRLKYASDKDHDIRCCEYCKHLISYEPAYLLGFTVRENVWCALDDTDEPVADRIRGCDKWERMPFSGFASHK